MVPGHSCNSYPHTTRTGHAASSRPFVQSVVPSHTRLVTVYSKPSQSKRSVVGQSTSSSPSAQSDFPSQIQSCRRATPSGHARTSPQPDSSAESPQSGMPSQRYSSGTVVPLPHWICGEHASSQRLRLGRLGQNSLRRSLQLAAPRQLRTHSSNSLGALGHSSISVGSKSQVARASRTCSHSGDNGESPSPSPPELESPHAGTNARPNATLTRAMYDLICTALVLSSPNRATRVCNE